MIFDEEMGLLFVEMEDQSGQENYVIGLLESLPNDIAHLPMDILLCFKLMLVIGEGMFWLDDIKMEEKLVIEELVITLIGRHKSIIIRLLNE